MENNLLKFGDTIFWYDDGIQKILKSKVMGIKTFETAVLPELPGEKHGMTRIYVTLPPIYEIHEGRAFGSREELCKYYRKIFRTK